MTKDITYGMTPQEKEIYFEHQEMRNREIAEKLDAEKGHLKVYRKKLIEDILRDKTGYSEEKLKSKSLRALEIIASY